MDENNKTNMITKSLKSSLSAGNKLNKGYETPLLDKSSIKKSSRKIFEEDQVKSLSENDEIVASSAGDILIQTRNVHIKNKNEELINKSKSIFKNKTKHRDILPEAIDLASSNLLSKNEQSKNKITKKKLIRQKKVISDDEHENEDQGEDEYSIAGNHLQGEQQLDEIPFENNNESVQQPILIYDKEHKREHVDSSVKKSSKKQKNIESNEVEEKTQTSCADKNQPKHFSSSKISIIKLRDVNNKKKNKRKETIEIEPETAMQSPSDSTFRVNTSDFKTSEVNLVPPNRSQRNLTRQISNLSSNNNNNEETASTTQDIQDEQGWIIIDCINNNTTLKEFRKNNKFQIKKTNFYTCTVCPGICSLAHDHDMIMRWSTNMGHRRFKWAYCTKDKDRLNLHFFEKKI
jgi:hypothetical protein